MRRFLKDHKDTNKEEIIEATKLYLRTQDPNFIRESHYFIFKGVGVSQVSDLWAYIETIRENKTTQSNNTDITQNIQ
jgi:hypothetical protein